MNDFQRALVSMETKAQFVQVARCPAGCVDDTHGAVFKFCGHGEAVIGIEIIHVDPVAFIFVEGFEAGEDTFDEL